MEWVRIRFNKVETTDQQVYEERKLAEELAVASNPTPPSYGFVGKEKYKKYTNNGWIFDEGNSYWISPKGRIADYPGGPLRGQV